MISGFSNWKRSLIQRMKPIVPVNIIAAMTTFSIKRRRLQKVTRISLIIPKAGRSSTNISGWLKNHTIIDKCPALPELLKTSCVKAASIAGTETSPRNDETSTDQTKTGNRERVSPGARIVIIVVMKLIKVIMNEIDPMTIVASINILKLFPSPSDKSAMNPKRIVMGSNKKAAKFARGNATLWVPIINGTNQLAKPPINAGITMKNTKISACAVLMNDKRAVSFGKMPSRKAKSFPFIERRKANENTAPMTPATIASTR